MKVIRKAHLTGLRPIVTVRFEASVNPEHQKPEQLEIEMKGAPYRLQGILLLFHFSANTSGSLCRWLLVLQPGGPRVLLSCYLSYLALG